MAERVAVLAVTKMLSGICIGGILPGTGKWVRPVKDFGTILLGDITYKDKTVMEPFDIVEFEFIKPRPRPPHREDWICSFIRPRPVRVGNVESRLEFMEKHADPRAAMQILNAQISLALIKPSSVEALFTMDSYSGKYEARLRIPEMGERPLPVTDIKWRALGRQLLNGGERLEMTFDEIKQRLGLEQIFVALGLGRMYEGRHWPLVIGVHTCPDYPAAIDYKNL